MQVITFDVTKDRDCAALAEYYARPLVVVMAGPQPSLWTSGTWCGMAVEMLKRVIGPTWQAELLECLASLERQAALKGGVR